MTTGSRFVSLTHIDRHSCEQTIGWSGHFLKTSRDMSQTQTLTPFSLPLSTCPACIGRQRPTSAHCRLDWGHVTPAIGQVSQVPQDPGGIYRHSCGQTVCAFCFCFFKSVISEQYSEFISGLPSLQIFL